MTKFNSPWAQRFSPYMCKDTLKQALFLKSPSISGAREMTNEGLIQSFESACKASFYPTRQSVDFALRVVEAMQIYCNQHYPNDKEFLRQLYLNDRHQEAINPIIITGLAGVGKSSLIRRLYQIFSAELMVKVDSSHPSFQIVGPALISVNERVSPQKIVESLSGSKNIDAARRKLYLRGVPGIFLDELQFLATSASANVAAAKVILGLRPLGIPFVVAANFSLMHKLLRRPEEERHRILTDVLVFEVDEPNSECWINSVKQVFSFLPEVIQIDVEMHADRLHRMAAGRIRALINLLKQGIRLIEHSNESLTMAVVERAYKSPGYFIHKEDAELIASYQLGGSVKVRTDLICPKPFQSDRPSIIKSIKSEVSQQVADLELRSALSKQARANLKQFEKNIVPVSKKNEKVIKLHSNKKVDLIENTTRFLEDL